MKGSSSKKTKVDTLRSSSDILENKVIIMHTTIGDIRVKAMRFIDLDNAIKEVSNIGFSIAEQQPDLDIDKLDASTITNLIIRSGLIKSLIRILALSTNVTALKLEELSLAEVSELIVIFIRVNDLPLVLHHLGEARRMVQDSIEQVQPNKKPEQPNSKEPEKTLAVSVL